MNVSPQLTVLSPEQIEQVHHASLDILSRAGVRVDSERARRFFAADKGVTLLDDGRVTIKPERISRALETAPRAIDIFKRTGEPAFRLGTDRTRFGVGVTNLFYQDPLTDDLSLFKRKHMEIGTLLGENLPGYDMVSTVGIIRDTPEGTADLYSVLEMAANTVKPLVILVSDEKQFTPSLDLLEKLCGDLSEKPFVMPYFNPVSPLVLNKDTADKMIDTIKRGLPFIFSNYGMAGTTTPITPAGTLALLNAELLAGLVFSQIVREGAPIILGSLPAFFDMKTMADFYDVHTILLNAACAEMMAHYGIPHAGTSGSGLGWNADVPAAGLFWLNHVTSLLGKSGMAPFVGGSHGSKAFSPTSVVYCNDVILQARRFADGFALDDEAIGVEEIIKAGAGGNFLSAKLTRKNFRNAYYSSSIFPRLSMEKWEELNKPQADKYLREATSTLISESKPPEDHDALIEKGEEFIRRTIL